MYVAKSFIERRCYKRCHVAHVRDLYKRDGSRVGEASFASLEEPLPMSLSKVDSLAYIAEFDDALNREDRKRSQASKPAPSTEEPEDNNS